MHGIDATTQTYSHHIRVQDNACRTITASEVAQWLLCCPLGGGEGEGLWLTSSAGGCEMPARAPIDTAALCNNRFSSVPCVTTVLAVYIYDGAVPKGQQ